MTSKEIEQLAPEAYLNPELFRTAWDRECNAEAQYRKGLEHGKAAEHISISVTGCWGGLMKDGGSLTSYERIGYHANTADLLRGFIDSGVKLVVYRWKGDSKVIRG